MNALHTDALVFFGATGDLAYKKIFPSLQAMMKRGQLDVPIIGVAKSGWNLDQMRARARESLQHHHAGLDQSAFEKLSRLLRYVDGDYQNAATFHAIRKELGSAKRPLHYLAIPPVLFAAVVEQLAHSGCNQGARVVLEKPFGTNLASAQELNRILHARFRKQRSFESIIISGNGRSRTCCISGSQMRSSRRSGTGHMSRAFRSRWPKSSASRAGEVFTIRPAPFVTSSKIIYSRFWPTSRWSRRSGWTANPYETKKSKC